MPNECKRSGYVPYYSIYSLHGRADMSQYMRNAINTVCKSASLPLSASNRAYDSMITSLDGNDTSLFEHLRRWWAWGRPVATSHARIPVHRRHPDLHSSSVVIFAMLMNVIRFVQSGCSEILMQHSQATSPLQKLQRDH